ncbi:MULTISPECIES: hypothetical protein [unclassified Pseudoxanthomonas]|uniref:hypothetical protein n=1 Tax=unclassified Pseudoxanthomonas TaxID=2645906 RepID=UPI00307774FF
MASMMTSGSAMACSIPGKQWPTTAELAIASDLVFIAHVERIRRMSPEDTKLMEAISSGNPPLNVAFLPPTHPADFSVLRVLKGTVPEHVLLQSAVQNCSGVHLEEGGDYLIFANRPSMAGDDIAPIKGSFKLDDSEYTQDELRKVEFLFPSKR